MTSFAVTLRDTSGLLVSQVTVENIRKLFPRVWLISLFSRCLHHIYSYLYTQLVTLGSGCIATSYRGLQDVMHGIVLMKALQKGVANATNANSILRCYCSTNNVFFLSLVPNYRLILLRCGLVMISIELPTFPLRMETLTFIILLTLLQLHILLLRVLICQVK